MAKKNFLSPVYTVNAVISALFDLITPIGLGTLGAWLLVTKCGAGEWVYVVLILLGLLIGLFSMVKCILSTMRALERLEEENAKKGDGRKGERK